MKYKNTNYSALRLLAIVVNSDQQFDLFKRGISFLAVLLETALIYFQALVFCKKIFFNLMPSKKYI